MKKKTKGLVAVLMILGLVFIVAAAVYAVNSEESEAGTEDLPEEADVPLSSPEASLPAVTEPVEDTQSIPQATDSAIENEPDMGAVDLPAATEEPQEKEPENSGELTAEEKAVKSSESLARILEFFKSNCPDSDAESFTVSGIPPVGYPEYYGGAYINASGELVVLLMEDTPDIRSMLCDIGENGDMLFAEADFSYRHLLEMAEEIQSFAKTGDTDSFWIASIDIDDFGNRVIVDLSDVSEETVNHFKAEVSDSKAILFIQTSSSVADY